MNLPARLGANLAQRLDEPLTILIIHGDQFAPVTAIHGVINRAGLLSSARRYRFSFSRPALRIPEASQNPR